MSRAVLLPVGNDPFVVMYGLRFYDHVWKDEVDKVYLYLNCQYISPEVEKFIEAQVAKRPEIIYKRLNPENYTHGEGLTQMVNDCKEDYVMLLEDDAFIYKQGEVNRNFKLVESGLYDYIGSRRWSIDMKVGQRAMEVFGIQDDPESYDNGPCFWCNFFFCKTDLLRQTDMVFKSIVWKKGERIDILDYTVEEQSGADTFSWASLQIQAISKRYLSIPQYKAYPHDFELHEQKRWTFNPQAGWIHAGSLSSGVNYNFRKDGIPLFSPDSNKMEREKITEPIAITDLEMRTAFWLMAFQATQDGAEEIADFRKEYQEALNEFVLDMGLDPDNISKRINIYRQKMGNKTWQ